MDQKGKSAKEVSKILSDSLKNELEKYQRITKNEVSPKEAGVRVVQAIQAKINEHKDYLVKMRQAEKGENLDKSDSTDAIAWKINKAESLSKPPVSEAQRRAMGAAASGNSTLGIPKSVGKEFIDADKGGKLPVKKGAGGAGGGMGGVLDKNLYGVPSSTPTSQEMAHDAGVKGKTVFDILAEKSAPVVKRELELEQESEKHSDPKTPGAVLPSDKPTEKQDHADAEGQIKKGKKLKKSESPLFKSLKKVMGVGAASTPMAASAASLNKDWIEKALQDLHKKDAYSQQDVYGKHKLSPAAEAAGAKLSPILTSIPKLKPGYTHAYEGTVGPHDTSIISQPEGGAKTRNMKAPKSGTNPDTVNMFDNTAVKKAVLGGKDPSSKMMTQHAMSQATKDAKNKLMPAQQQSHKMPSPADHVNRANVFEAFTPKSKFGKNEIAKTIAELDKKMMDWGK